MMALENTLLNCFSNMEDPRCRSHRNFQYSLDTIFIITILAVICGANNWTEIEQFGQDKEEWLRTFLDLPNGIPSHDTFSRVFTRLNPVVFESHFNAWICSLQVDLKDEVIALDGKTLRGSGNKREGKSPIHMVHAWATKQRLLLSQVKTHVKSNEITAIPELLKLLDIQGAVVSIDAMGCQTGIARQIIRQGGHYVLSLKANQPTLLQEVSSIFAEAESGSKPYKGIWHRRKVVKKHGHGRIETRRYTVISAKDKGVGFSLRFPSLTGLVKLEVTRTTNNKVEKSTRYFVTSFSYAEIDRFVEAVEHHWRIEIDLHWSLDVSFQEDLNQSHLGHSAQNLSLLRRIALNILKQDKTHKRGINCRRKAAGWNHNYLLKVLVGSQKIATASP